MGKKKSLGHNPLAYSMLNASSFTFIPEATGQATDEGKTETANISSKVTVSYYLEEKLVNKIKTLAENRQSSYSALVNRMLKQKLKEYTD